MSQLASFEVVVPTTLTKQWAALSVSDHRRLNKRLRRAARAAVSDPVLWPTGPAGRNRGKHRAIIEDLWVTFQVNENAHTLDLLGFGHVA